MISAALYVLTGLAAYILTLQDHPSESAGTNVGFMSLAFDMISAYLVGRPVKAAKTANAARATDADGTGIAMVQHPARTLTGYSSV